jgi:hypothetical protein
VNVGFKNKGEGMTGVVEVGKSELGEKEIVDIGIDWLIEGRSISECRSYVLSEFRIDPENLEFLLAMASQQVDEWRCEVGRRLRF